MCEAEAPDLFEVGDDGSLSILDDAPDVESRHALWAAIEACPTEALSLEEHEPAGADGP
jgi:ferredoxin